MQSMGPHGGMPRNSPDADRWRRAVSYQKGLIPSPQILLPMMHKAEKKYEVGKVTNTEEVKQRQLKAILNKLTPQNFEKLLKQVKAVNIDNAVALTGVVLQIFDRALMEPIFCEMYANFCCHLAYKLPDFSVDNEKITFRRLLLNKCQEEFERGERGKSEQEEANNVPEEGEAKESEEEREEKRIKAPRRMLGNIRLIGELYKNKMLIERIMHECIKKLLGECENPDEEDVEALCKLMSTIGDMIDHPKAKVYMDAYFERMTKLSNNMKLSSRVRFMLKDVIDLRKNKWQQRRKVEGPKKIEEVRRDAAQERQAQASRLARGSGINPAAGRAPMNIGPRGSMLSSPGAQMGSFRGFPTQLRDLRKSKWQQCRKVEGPKKIEEVHRDVAQERQVQASSLARGPGISPAARRAPMDFGPRGSMLSSPGAQMGSFRGFPTQLHRFGTQDVRMDERQSFEASTLSVPLPQRPIVDDSITLGPQDGFARGMSFRGPSAMSTAYLADVSPASGDSRRMPAGLNGFSSVSEQTTYSSREDLMPRYMADRFAEPAAFDQLSSQERGMSFRNRDLRNPDRSFDRPLAASPPARGQASGFPENILHEKALPEERLRDMSMAAIKEFYSARDEKEVAMCIKDLNSPSFHPTMIALWVTYSFERKATERDLLAKLLVNLTRSHDGVLSQVQLVKGFESVLRELRDAVNDAPKAAEYVGRIFAQIILEKVISLSEIGRLLYEGGEEPGQLLETGLAGDVLGSTLGIIKTDKGETELNEFLGSSNLRLEDLQLQILPEQIQDIGKIYLEDSDAP